jgi:hypothetical protein
MFCTAVPNKLVTHYRLILKSLVVKIFNFFSFSAKHTKELNTIFDFPGEDFKILLCYVAGGWLILHTAVERLVKCWPAVKSYFLSLRADDCPHQI